MVLVSGVTKADVVWHTAKRTSNEVAAMIFIVIVDDILFIIFPCVSVMNRIEL